MDLLTKWLLLAFTQTVATISPGPAFALTIKNAVSGDRNSGLMTSLGLGLGVGIYAALTLSGFSVIISSSPLLFNIIKYSGAAYLVYIGIKALRAKPAQPDCATQTLKACIEDEKINLWKAFQTGLLTNLLNPKAVVFFTAIYAQFLTPETTVSVMALYAFTSMVIETVWFFVVTLVLTTQRAQSAFNRVAHWIERSCGGLMVMLGLKIALTK